MRTPGLTLAAALRDAESAKVEVRVEAIDNLPRAFLVEIAAPSPTWDATAGHARGDEVVATLRRALRDADRHVRGLAATGLGSIGHGASLPDVQALVDLRGGDPGDAFVRQCGVIAASLLAVAAPDAHEDLRARVRTWLGEMRRSPYAEVRFQSATALVEIDGDAAESELLAMLDEERDAEVREGIVEALAGLDPPSAACCDRLERVLDEDGAVGLRAAFVLAAGRRKIAAPRLAAALADVGERDRALEALAVLGTCTPDIAAVVRGLAAGLLTPGVTRVRAAYALAKIAPDPTQRSFARGLLGRLRWHPRGAVREAVADATRLLDGPDAPPDATGGG